MTNQQMSQACPGRRGDLAAYLVGALDPPAADAVRRHLGTCPACQAEYEDLVPVVGWLALLSPPGPGNMRVTGGKVADEPSPPATYPLDPTAPGSPAPAGAAHLFFPLGTRKHQ